MLRKLVKYIRELFCVHDWELLQRAEVKNPYGEAYKVMFLYRCKKCGASKRYEIKP